MSQGFGESSLTHHMKGNAIGQRPLLIETLAMQTHSCNQKLTAGINQFAPSLALDVFSECLRSGAVVRFGKGVDALPQHMLSDNEPSFQMLRPSHRSCVQWVARIEEREKIPRVHEGHGCFGNPYT